MSIPHNTGYKVYTLLMQVSDLTGQPTGVQKPNVPSDPDYIAPVLDTDMCPLEGGSNTMAIQVIIATDYTADISITFGAAVLTRSSSGTWTVPLRTYDTVIINAAPAPYKYKITYNSGLTKTAIVTTIGELIVSGPYIAITKIEIISQLGEFSDDFTNDFNN